MNLIHPTLTQHNCAQYPKEKQGLFGYYLRNKTSIILQEIIEEDNLHL